MLESEWVLFLTKLLPVFVYPLGLAIWLLLLGGLFAALRRRRVSLICGGAALILLWVCSTPMFARWAMASLERQYPAVPIEEIPKSDVAIVLGGVIGQPVPPRVSPDLSQASDRILHAARLYRAGKVERILVTAGNIPWLPAVKTEAELIEELLIEWGVPKEAIQIAGASRNTYENAVEIKSIWERSSFSSALLVTSGAHMPRALSVFQRAGLPVVPATTDVEVIDEPASNILVWFPQADALAMTTNAVREWIGIWAYRVRGYL